MTYEEFEILISPVRLARYHAACSNSKPRTLKLYRANTRLSGELLSILGMFEVVLRNKIDTHYKTRYPAVPGGEEWPFCNGWISMLLNYSEGLTG